jgi:hypothetical protein
VPRRWRRGQGAGGLVRVRILRQEDDGVAPVFARETSGMGGVRGRGIGDASPMGAVTAAGGEHRVRAVEVEAHQGGPAPQAFRIPVRGAEQVLEDLAAQPVLGLGDGAFAEQHQRGDERGTLEGTYS